MIKWKGTIVSQVVFVEVGQRQPQSLVQVQPCWWWCYLFTNTWPVHLMSSNCLWTTVGIMNYILNDPPPFLMSHTKFNLTVCTHGLGGGLGAPKCFQCSNICHGTYTERGIWVMYRKKCIWNVCREKNHENNILGRSMDRRMLSSASGSSW